MQRITFSIGFLLVSLMFSACDQRPSAISEATEIREPAGTRSTLPWMSDFDAALKQAKEQHKPVLVDFFATWCGPCKLMDQKTFPDPTVANELANWITVKVDVDQQQDLARKFNVQAMPTTILLNPDGQVISSKVGYIEPSEFLSFVEAGRKTMAK